LENFTPHFEAGFWAGWGSIICHQKPKMHPKCKNN
jgi:hypothetical protein